MKKRRNYALITKEELRQIEELETSIRQDDEPILADRFHQEMFNTRDHYIREKIRANY